MFGSIATCGSAARALATTLRMARPSNPDALAGTRVELVSRGKLANPRNVFARPFRQSTRICLQRHPAGQWHLHHHHRNETGHLSTACGKLLVLHEQQMRVAFGQHVQLHQHRIGGSVHINRVGFQAELGSISRKLFRPRSEGRSSARRCGFCDRLREQVCHGALSLFPLVEPGQRVRFHFQQSKPQKKKIWPHDAPSPAAKEVFQSPAGRPTRSRRVGSTVRSTLGAP